MRLVRSVLNPVRKPLFGAAIAALLVNVRPAAAEDLVYYNLQAQSTGDADWLLHPRRNIVWQQAGGGRNVLRGPIEYRRPEEIYRDPRSGYYYFPVRFPGSGNGRGGAKYFGFSTPWDALQMARRRGSGRLNTAAHAPVPRR